MTRYLGRLLNVGTTNTVVPWDSSVAKPSVALAADLPVCSASGIDCSQAVMPFFSSAACLHSNPAMALACCYCMEPRSHFDGKDRMDRNMVCSTDRMDKGSLCVPAGSNMDPNTLCSTFVHRWRTAGGTAKPCLGNTPPRVLLDSNSEKRAERMCSSQSVRMNTSQAVPTRIAQQVRTCTKPVRHTSPLAHTTQSNNTVPKRY